MAAKKSDSQASFGKKVLQVAGVVFVILFVLALVDNGNDSESSNTDDLREDLSEFSAVLLTLSENNPYDTKESVQQITELAVRKKDAELCDGISYDYSRSWCYQQVAVETKNEKLCEEIEFILEDRSSFEPTALAFADQCVGAVKNSIEAEKKIQELQTELGGTELEAYIVPECEANKVARGSCYGDKAQQERKPEYCEFMEEQYIDNCKQSVVYIKQIDQIEKTGTVEDCEQIPRDFYFKGYMYLWCKGRFS